MTRFADELARLGFQNSIVGEFVEATDLYKGFLQRAPDTPGLNNWVSQVPVNGRNNVRLALTLPKETFEPP